MLVIECILKQSSSEQCIGIPGIEYILYSCDENCIVANKLRDLFELLWETIRHDSLHTVHIQSTVDSDPRLVSMMRKINFLKSCFSITFLIKL